MLFNSIKINKTEFSNRVVMAPLTRRRADMSGLTANNLMAKYYAQRSSAGLIISEGS